MTSTEQKISVKTLSDSINEAERHQVLRAWNDTAAETPRTSVLELFADRLRERREQTLGLA